MSVALRDHSDTDLHLKMLSQYQRIRQHSLSLIEPLSAEDCALQGAPYTSPVKWHLAHTTWFFETFLLLPNLTSYQSIHPQYQYLFNSYYNGVGQQYPRPKRHLLSRPSLDDILKYRRQVDVAMSQFIEGASDQQLALVELGIHHEQQHQELLLMDLKFNFFQNPLFPTYGASHVDGPKQLIQHEGFQSFSGGLFEIGNQAESFCFDNETPKHQTYLQPFQLSRSLVTNGEYLEFIEDGGYHTPDNWLSDGWAWVQQSGAQHPLYWLKKKGDWFEYSLQGLKPLNLKQAVSHISFYEALAYAQWRGCRLPSEAEWEVAAQQTLYGPHQTSLAHMFDHNWQWTQSAYQPYPGFKVHDGAVGEYNGKFMCNQMVLRGGCDLTPPQHSRITYRNFFYPQDQWPKTGIRLAKDVSD